MQEEMDQQYRSKLIPAGIEIHRLLQNSFEVRKISVYKNSCNNAALFSFKIELTKLGWVLLYLSLF